MWLKTTPDRPRYLQWKPGKYVESDDAAFRVETYPVSNLQRSYHTLVRILERMLLSALIQSLTIRYIPSLLDEAFLLDSASVSMELSGDSS